LSTTLFRFEARRKEGKKGRGEERRKKEKEKGEKPKKQSSEPIPLERGRHMSNSLPRAPLARTLGAEDPYMFTGYDELRRRFDNISRGKEITQTHSLSAYL